MYHILGHHEYIVCLFPNSLFPFFILVLCRAGSCKCNAGAMKELQKNNCFRKITFILLEIQFYLYLEVRYLDLL
jgi:hypothetical protein